VQAARRLLGLATVLTLVLAMPLTSSGVAWPSMAGDLAMPVGQLGLLIAVSVGGFLVSTLSSGSVAARIGPGSMLRWAAALAAVGIAGQALAPNRAVLLASVLVLGFAAGYLEAGTNTHVTLRHGARGMGMLHAGYGIGAALGPLFFTTLISAGVSWRWGFAGLAIVQVAVVVLMSGATSGWASSPPPPEGDRRSRRLPGSAWWALGLFVLYTGFEVGAGQWAFTLFTEGRGLTAAVAGLAVTGFYGALTAARLLLTGLGDRLPAPQLSTGSAVVAVVAMAVVWWSPAPWVGPAALVVCGFSMGPIFPLQMLLTPGRTGTGGTANMVGYQMAAASLGASLVPGLIGLLVGPFGVPVVAPVLVATGSAMVLVDLRLRTAAVAIAPATPVPGSG
jgi:fucose permease